MWWSFHFLCGPFQRCKLNKMHSFIRKNIATVPQNVGHLHFIRVYIYIRMVFPFAIIVYFIIWCQIRIFVFAKMHISPVKMLIIITLLLIITIIFVWLRNLCLWFYERSASQFAMIINVIIIINNSKLTWKNNNIRVYTMIVIFNIILCHALFRSSWRILWGW